MGTKFPFFNFPVCKIYLGTWARRARRTREHVDHVEHLKLRYLMKVFETPLNDYIWLTERDKIYTSYFQGSRKQ